VKKGDDRFTSLVPLPHCFMRPATEGDWAGMEPQERAAVGGLGGMCVDYPTLLATLSEVQRYIVGSKGMDTLLACTSNAEVFTRLFMVPQWIREGLGKTAEELEVQVETQVASLDPYWVGEARMVGGGRRGGQEVERLPLLLLLPPPPLPPPQLPLVTPPPPPPPLPPPPSLGPGSTTLPCGGGCWCWGSGQMGGKSSL
jgi:hypothetical protein